MIASKAKEQGWDLVSKDNYPSKSDFYLMTNDGKVICTAYRFQGGICLEGNTPINLNCKYWKRKNNGKRIGS